MKCTRWVAVALMGLFMFSTNLVFAQSRDSDGTRMQARQVEVGSTHKDSLAPPEDRADWRMVRLDAAKELRVNLQVRGGEATVTLTSASGERLESRTAGSQAATIQKRLDAGIYYIAVESSEAVRYELSIR